MILEKEDWEEPECCFRPHIAAAEAVHTGSADGGPSVREVIQGFDRLLDRDAKREAAIYLGTGWPGMRKPGTGHPRSLY